MPSFSPIVGVDSEILILGSMPSQRSLTDSCYYAHPQNSFWWIMSRILGFPENVNYQEKCKYLSLSKYALWDVLYDCQRLGSLDSNIKLDSEQVNDFKSFFADHKKISLIAFNGAAARKIFMRHCAKILSARGYIRSVQLPSTSPAHARLNREQKLQKWREELCSFD